MVPVDPERYGAARRRRQVGSDGKGDKEDPHACGLYYELRSQSKTSTAGFPEPATYSPAKLEPGVSSGGGTAAGGMRVGEDGCGWSIDAATTWPLPASFAP
jgi:hypothetical protein